MLTGSLASAAAWSFSRDLFCIANTQMGRIDISATRMHSHAYCNKCIRPGRTGNV